MVAKSDPDSNDDLLGSLVNAVRALDQFERDVIARARLIEPGHTPTTTGPPPALNDFVVTPPHDTYRPKTRLTDEQRRQIVNAYLAGATTYELADQFGIHRTTVANLVRKAGHKISRTGLLPEELPEAIRHYANGESCRRIAQRFETSPENVRLHLKAAGVTMRSRGGKR